MTKRIIYPEFRSIDTLRLKEIDYLSFLYILSKGLTLFFITIGIMPFSISSVAISIGSQSSGPWTFTRIGAPIEICNARAPIILAFSYLVYF